MAKMKILLSIICFFGGGVIVIDDQLEGIIMESLQVSPRLQEIIGVLLVILIIIKIIWYIIDKIIQVKERFKKMKDHD